MMRPVTKPDFIVSDASLARRTTLGVGGAAAFLAPCPDVDALNTALDFAARRELPVMVLGGGSNLLVADTGFPGLVITIEDRHLDVRRDGESLLVSAGAGLDWDGFVADAVAADWAGVECLAGIPGRVGAAPIQNIGAYGQEIADTVATVTAFDRVTREVEVVERQACGFGYRTSWFKRDPDRRYIVLSVTFRLLPQGAPTLKYAELVRHVPHQPSLSQTRDTVLLLRGRKSMLLVPGDPDCRSAGSFFLNPIVDAAVADRIASRVPGEKMPRWPQDDGVKLSAAWLIQRAGMDKGFGSGPVGLSTKHTLAIVNRGEACAADVVRFAREVRAGVERKFGVRLVPEPVLVGFSEGF